MNDKEIIWYYKIKTIEGDIKTSIWATALKPSKICKWFEDIGAEVLELRHSSPGILYGYIMPQNFTRKEQVAI